VKKILVVDDEANVAASVRLVLEGAGYAVDTCRTAAECTRHVARSRADAYLLDVRLPDGNGIDLLPVIRHRYPQAPIVMISGHATASAIVACPEIITIGACGYL